MKLLYQFNKICLIINLILYLTFFFGLYAQIVLGGIQVISAIGLFFIWKKFKDNHKKQFLIYWILVSLYGIAWLSEIQLNDFWWLSIIVIPMSIAIYFVWLLNNLKNINDENRYS